MANSSTVQAAIAERDAKVAAHTKAKASEAIPLRDQIVKTKLALLGAKPGTPEANELDAALKKLIAQRDALMTSTEVTAAQEKASEARRAAKKEATKALVASLKLGTLKDDDLAAKRQELTEQRKKLKIELKAVMLELEQRAAKARITDLVASLSDEEKAQVQAALTPTVK